MVVGNTCMVVDNLYMDLENLCMDLDNLCMDRENLYELGKLVYGLDLPTFLFFQISHNLFKI